MRVVLFAFCLMACAGGARADTPGAAANAAYLTANAGKAGTITRPSGLQYRVLHTGYGHRAGADDLVHLVYSMKLIDGTLLDSATSTLPATLAVNGVALAGLGEALLLMHEGDRWLLVVPPNLGFGKKANPVLSGQTLVIDVTLLSAAAPRPGEVPTDNMFSLWGSGTTHGAAITIHP